MGLEILLVVIISCLPIILVSLYIYKKDNDKEPVYLLRKLFFCGIFSIIPIVILELLTDSIGIFDKNNIISLFINVFVTVGLIEEAIKWIIVIKLVYNDIEFNHAYDAIIYCVFTSLGFALVENILYVYSSGILTGLLRSVTTIPAHTFNGVIMGYFLGLTKEMEIKKDENNSKKYMFLSLFIPVLSHTLFDFLLHLENTIASIIFIVFMIIMYIIIYIIIKNVSIKDKNLDGSKYNSKRKIKYESDNDLFIYAFSKVFLISLILLLISGIIIIVKL